MAILNGWRWLSSSRIKMIVQTLASRVDVSVWPLLFLDRTPVVQADDDEIVGRFTGNVLAADIIADDQEAVVYEAGKLELVSTQIPNLKIGSRLGQATLNRMNRMRNGAILPTDENFMETWENQFAERLVFGVRQRMNALICAMMLDSLTYNRLGIQVNGTWGMPSVLKATPTTPWDNTAATPFTDLLTMSNETAGDLFGIHFDRVTMSSKAFRYMVLTDQFKQLAQKFYGIAATTVVNVKDQPAMVRMVSDLLSMDVELYDGTIKEKTGAGTVVRTRVLPANKVLLSIKANDNDPTVMDFANGVVTESIVAGLIGNGPGDLGGGEQYGPIGYYTGRDDLNPPDVVGWAVARGFPRKHSIESTSVLTVGTFT
jgi:hypothetical protein